MRIITGIGARATPPAIQDEMILIGTFCKDNDIWVRSGHAEGADWAFERGAQEKCIAYLPWPSFNNEKRFESRALKPVFNTTPFFERLVDIHHPKPKTLTQSIRKLMARNGAQIFGTKEPFVMSSAVVCWTPDGMDVGGTSQAIRIARSRNIPIINMALHQYSNHLKVQNRLMEILS